MGIARILAIVAFLIASSPASASFVLYSAIEEDSPLSFAEWEKVSAIRPDGFSPVPDNPYHVTIITHPIWPKITFDSSLWDDYGFAALIIDGQGGSYGFKLPVGQSSFYFNGVISRAALYSSGSITPVIAPVPAPTALVLFGSALLGLAMIGGKTRSSHFLA